MSPHDPAIVSEALVAWITGSHVPYPRTDDAQVDARFGDSVASELLPVLRDLRQECLDLDAQHRAADLADVAALVRSQMHERHPELTDEAVAALANLYAWIVK